MTAHLKQECTHASDALAMEIGNEGRPARRCRSALWLHRQEIAQWVSEGYTYAQIARVLSRVGHTVTAAWLERWCRRNLGRVYQPESPGSDPPKSVCPSPPTGETRPTPAGPPTPVAPAASAGPAPKSRRSAPPRQPPTTPTGIPPAIASSPPPTGQTGDETPAADSAANLSDLLSQFKTQFKRPLK